jgi:aminopeptidase N
MKKLTILLFVLATAAPLTGQPRQIANNLPDRPQIDVSSYAVEITMMPEEHRLTGRADIQFRQLDRQDYATFDLDRRLRVTAASIAGTDIRYRQFDLDSTVEVDLSGQQFAADPVVHLEYEGVLNPEEDRREPVLASVSDDSAFLLYEGKWFPTNGLHQDKADMRLRVNAPANWTVVTDLPASTSDFPYASTVSSYWGMVAAGAYTPTTIKNESGEVTLDALKAPAEVATPVAEAVGKMLDFYAGKFGPPPSSQFRIVEVEGANWESRWSVGTLLLPSAQLRKDFDPSILARNVAHQWFPLKINVKDPATDAWLVDGLAVFASLIYFEKSLSPADSQEHIQRALVKALGYEGSNTVLQAGGLDKDSADYRSLVEYKGAFIFRMLQWVIGDEKFDTLLAQYVDRFKDTPASTAEFQRLSSNVADEDLTYFFDQWLNSSGVPEFSDEYTVFRARSGYKVMGQIKQDLDLFRMPVEVEIQTDGDPEYGRIVVSGPSSDFDIVTQRKPRTAGLVIDPHKKVLRMSSDIRIAVLINRGEELSNRGEFNAAIDEFQKAVDIDDLNSLALFRMGEAFFELGNLQLAADMFRAATNGDLKPKWVEVWSYVNLGKIFDIRGSRERAVTEYQKAVNTGDDAYGAQAEAQKYMNEPFRRSGRPTIGD